MTSSGTDKQGPGAVQPVSRPVALTPAPPTLPVTGAPGIDRLTTAEQARLRELPERARQQVLEWVASGDPICLGEARRRLGLPRPPETPPWALATAELLRGLPGRPDRVAAAAGRLAEELGDPKSYRYYLSVAESVCTRRHPAGALVAAWRQGKSPRAERPGAVFAAAWKREVRLPGWAAGG